MKDNLILIGMPGSGKSTLGVILAKTLCLGFIDTDLILQEKEQRSLQLIINQDGIDLFLVKEEAAILSLSPSRQVIATGGSAILSDAAVRQMQKWGLLIFLDVPVDELEKRVQNIGSRGIVKLPGQDLQALADIRRARYLQYADLVIQAGRMNPEQVLEQIIRALSEKALLLNFPSSKS